MYFLRLTLHFILTIPHITSYVLLAANIDDFKSLAKKIIPDDINEEILAVESDSNQSEKKIDNLKESADKDENDSLSKESKPYIKAKDSPKIKLKINLDDIVEKVKDKIHKELAIITSNHQRKKKHSKLIKVQEGSKLNKKDKLITKDFIDSVENTNSGKKPHVSDIKETRSDEEDLYKYNRPKTDRKKQHKQRIQDNKYVAELFVAPSAKPHKENRLSSLQPKVLSKQKIPKRKKIAKQLKHEMIRPKYSSDQDNKKESQFEDSHDRGIGKKVNKYLSKEEKDKKRLVNSEDNRYDGINIEETATNIENLMTSDTKADEIHKLFNKFDMINKNDSYEDYVIPKKDYSYEEKPSSYSKSKTFDHRITTSKKYKDVNADSDNKYGKNSEEMNSITPKYVKQKMSAATVDDDTTKHNWNKKKRFDVKKEINHNNNPERQGSIKIDNLAPILPHPTEQDQNSEESDQPYAQQINQVTTDYVDETELAVTDELKARTESLIEYNEQQYVQNIPKIKKISTKKVSKSGTDIPKRDFYKMSTPDYLGKIPVVGEKYKFDEPIPEEDREPENLKPIGKPPSSINGKVKAD